MKLAASNVQEGHKYKPHQNLKLPTHSALETLTCITDYLSQYLSVIPTACVCNQTLFLEFMHRRTTRANLKLAEFISKSSLRRLYQNILCEDREGDPCVLVETNTK